jgi:hypothetical protein
MRRQRSISFYAETEEEFIQEYDRRKSISERRRCRARSYGGDNEENLDTQKIMIIRIIKKNIFNHMMIWS